MLDEALDNSKNQQMAVVLRYINNNGEVMKRFVEVVHVSDTISLSIKYAIDNFFAKHGLSISKLCFLQKKRKNTLLAKQHENMVAHFKHGEISTRRGLHVPGK